MASKHIDALTVFGILSRWKAGVSALQRVRSEGRGVSFPSRLNELVPELEGSQRDASAQIVETWQRDQVSGPSEVMWGSCGEGGSPVSEDGWAD